MKTITNKQKNALYESIMKSVSKTVMSRLNSLSLNESNSLNTIYGNFCLFMKKYSEHYGSINIFGHNDIEIKQRVENLTSTGYTDYDSLHDPDNFITNTATVYITCAPSYIQFVKEQNNVYKVNIGLEVHDALPFQDDYINDEIYFTAIYNMNTDSLSFNEGDVLTGTSNHQLKKIFDNIVNCLDDATNHFNIPSSSDDFEEMYEELDGDGLNF